MKTVPFKWWLALAQFWLALAELVGGPETAQPAETTNVAEAAWRVVVPDQVRPGTGVMGFNCGSGTAIAPRWVLTNSHVVEHAKGVGRLCQLVRGDRRIAGQICSVHPQFDLALIYLTEEVDHVAIAEREPQPGEPIAYGGFGGTGQLNVKRGKVVAHGQSGMHGGVPVVEVTPNSISGDSGSGVCNADGELVAIVWGSDHSQALAVSAQEFLKWKPAIETQCGPLGCTIGRRVYPNQPAYRQPIASQPSPQPSSQPSAPLAPLPPIPPPFNPAPLNARMDAIEKRLDGLEALAERATGLIEKMPLSAKPGPAGPAGPKGDPGPPGPAGKDAQCDEQQIVAAVIDKLGDTLGQQPHPANPVNPVETGPATGNPSPTHFVLVADLESHAYRQIESSWLVPARKTLPGHVVDAKRMSFSVTPLPQLVVYDAQRSPLSIAKGSYDVERVLKQLAQK